MLDSELRDVVRAFMERLAPRERSIAQLRFIDGLSQELVTKRLSATRYEVRTCEANLREALTQYLRGQGWLDVATLGARPLAK